MPPRVFQCAPTAARASTPQPQELLPPEPVRTAAPARPQGLELPPAPRRDRDSESLTLSERGGKWEGDQEREREKGRLNEGHGG